MWLIRYVIRHRRWWEYLLAIGSTVLVLALRVEFNEQFGAHRALIVFLVPIVISASIGGLRAGLLSTAITAVGVNYYVLPPVHTFWVHSKLDCFQWLLLIASGVLISWLSEWLQALRRRAERLAREHAQEELRFRLIAETLPQLVWTARADGLCDYLSPQWITYTGVPLERQLTRGWLEQLHPEDREGTLQAWEMGVKNPELGFQVEYRIRRYDGVYRWFDTRGVALRDASGAVVKWFGSNTDIEDRRQSESRLQESEARFRTVVESGPEAIFIQTHCCFAYVNPMAVQLFGEENAEQLLGKPVIERFHPDDRDKVSERIRQLNEERRAVAVRAQRIVRPDGSVCEVEVSAVPFTYQGESGALVFAHDITQRRQAEEQLRLQSSALESADNAMVITDAKGVILWVNPAYTRMTGYGREELVGQHVSKTRSGMHAVAFYDDIWQTINDGRVWHGELISRRKSGEMYPVELTVTPVLNSAGTLAHFIGVQQEVTDRKKAEAERKQLERQLYQAQKMDALGRLSGGIAHDFNNILTAISGHLRLARENLGNDAPALWNVQEIEKAAKRASDLVRHILSFSRSDEVKLKPLALGPVVDEAVKLLRAILPASVEIRVRAEADLPAVNADSTQIHQIIMNLGSNAAHAMGAKGGMLELALERLAISDHEARLVPDLREQTYVRLKVTDNGCGMDKATMEHIFEPFFTTKQVGEGTGLGLSVVHGIMKSHRGAITVYSQPGQGTAFHLYFPATERAPTPVRAASSSVLFGEGQRVLYVDDEKMLVTVTTNILNRIGYKATGFISPAEALEAFRENPDRFDAVISDYSMPQMNGFEFLAKIREVRPQCPTILASGYFRPEDKEIARSMKINRLISKPNTVDDLESALYEIFHPAA